MLYSSGCRVSEITNLCLSDFLNGYDRAVVTGKGDKQRIVYFSDEAIKTIVNTEVEDTMFICTCDGTDRERHPLNQKGREPFGYIVKNQVVFQYAIKKIKQMVDAGMFKDNLTPISWHLYRFLNGYDVKPYAKEYTEVNNIFQNIGDYLIIDDYTVDIDTDRDIDNLENILKER